MDLNARIGLIALGILCAGATAAAAQPSAIAAENARPGTTDWVLTKVEAVPVNVRADRYRRQRSIEGYVSHASIRAGETLTGFVSTQPASRCRVEIYRMGWYGGRGGRAMTTLGPLNGVAQPEPVERRLQRGHLLVEHGAVVAAGVRQSARQGLHPRRPRVQRITANLLARMIGR